jgi:hypothetical protein
MKQKMLIFLSLIFLIALLVGINALSYTQKDKEPDSEVAPNRSTYNSGATGTRAFYDLLAETGRKVVRWQDPPSSLFTSISPPTTLVIIGATRLEIEEKETEEIRRWVSAGGNLVIIDREPPSKLISTTGNWSISTVPSKNFSFNVDPSDQIQMTAQTPAFKPSQPSIFTRSVNAVQPSRFASAVELEFFGAESVISTPAPSPTPFYDYEDESPPPVAGPQPTITPLYKLPPTPKPTPIPTIMSSPGKVEKVETVALEAPFVHLSHEKQNILVDFPYGSGRIIYLTDPYIVSNAGIRLVDNARLATNIVGSYDGLIAFDEYHQGYGANNGTIFGYFAGTPVVAIFGQLCLLVGVLFWSNSRRFARPLPTDEPDRLSKLEYVSAMAELQQRTRAYDLALENIYSEFRRSVTRLLGLDNFTTSRKDLARALSERLKSNELEIYNLMRHCEEIIQGEPTNKRQVLELTGRLRQLEEKLGIKRTRKQAFRR